MRAYEIIREEIALNFESVDIELGQIHRYLIERSRLHSDIITGPYFQSKIANGFRRIDESESSIKSFIDAIQSTDYAKKIRIGDLFTVINFELNYGFKEIYVDGFLNPKEVASVKRNNDGSVVYIEFTDGDRYPRQTPAVYSGRPVVYSIYFKSQHKAKEALTYSLMVVPNDWNVLVDPALSIINEGGWDTAATQSTVVNPQVVRLALSRISQFTADFNKWLTSNGHPEVKMGHPTGSSAYYDVDPEDKVYGDIDLQMIAPSSEGFKSHSQFQGHWNKLAAEFVSTVQPPYVLVTDSKPGHPIIAIGADKYVQVDLMWHEEKTKDWGRFRVTPERGIKGLLTGNMFSVLGELLGMSVQHAGVQVKTSNGKPVPFTKQKDTQIETISLNPRTFVLDILNYLYDRQNADSAPTVSDRLKKNPGVAVPEVKISSLVNAVKGLAESFELNDMYGKDMLAGFSSAGDFLTRFFDRYKEKAMVDVNSAKRSKAETPEAKARAEADRQKVLSGLDLVSQLFRGK